MSSSEPLDELLASLRDAKGRALEVTRATPVSGGDINQCLRLECPGQSWFLKLNRSEHLTMFTTEAAALKELADDIRVPHVVGTGVVGTHAYLLMEHLSFGRRNADSDRALGRALARLHAKPRSSFGWHQENFIGTTPQPNPSADNWIDFYAEHRLRWQLSLLQQQGMADDALSDVIARLIERLPALFVGYDPFPSLLHGDLWGGNQAVLQDGSPVLFDPASYYGDRETDIAMTELFGGFGPEFRAAYEQTLPLDSGYPRRRGFYQLYHLLNHANLFGGSYVEQSRRMAERVLDQI